MKKYVRDFLPVCCAALLMAGCGNHVNGTGGNSGGVQLSPEEQEAFSEGLTGVTKYINSEDLLIQAIGESIVEYIQEFSSSGYGPNYGEGGYNDGNQNDWSEGREAGYREGYRNGYYDKEDGYEYNDDPYSYRAAVTTGAGAASQVKDFVGEVLKVWESVMDSFSQDGGASSVKVSFDKTVDIGGMKAEEWKKASFEVLKFIASKSGYDGTEQEAEEEFEDVLRMVQRQMGFFTDSAFYDFIDDVISIKKLYLSAKANVDYDWSEDKKDSKTLSTASMDWNVAVAALNVNRILSKLYSKKVDLPVKALSLAVSGKVDARATNADITNLVEYMADPEDARFNPSGSAKADVEADINLQTTLCTATGLGGIVSAGISARAGLKNLDDIIALLPYFIFSYPEDSVPGAEGPSEEYKEYGMMRSAAVYSADSDDEMSTESLLKILDKLITVSISVSNGSSDTFRKTYTPSQIYNLIMDVLI